MRIFNLSDETPPYKPERKARTLKIRGVKIEAGGSSEVPDSVPISEFSGLVSTNMVSIDYVHQGEAGQGGQVDAYPGRARRIG